MKLVEAVDYIVRTPDGNALQSGITFGIKSGDRLGITGPSGCGKSTFLRQIAAKAAQPNASEASLTVTVASADFLPQGEFLFPWFTAKQNYNAWLGRKVGLAIEGPDLARAETLEIETLLDRRFSDLSGGERQRVALWTALSREIDLLIVDEPFTALDIERKSACLEVLATALSSRLKALIFVSHDYDVLTYLANRILLLSGENNSQIREFDFPGTLPSNRSEYLERRASNQYANLLQALTGAN